nr:hypothetical protein [Acidimicrobiales bacterium]
SSSDSAAYAAHFGLPLAWADFIAQVDGAPIVDAYRRQFQPSDRCPEPRVLLCSSAVVADTDDEAKALVAAVQAWRASGLRGPIPAAPEGSTSRPVPIQPGRRSVAHGSPTRVADRLRQLVDGFGAEELMVVTICHDHEARVHSYELLAAEFGLPTGTEQVLDE